MRPLAVLLLAVVLVAACSRSPTSLSIAIDDVEDVVAFTAISEVPERDIQILEQDEVFLVPEFIEPIGVVGDLRVYRVGGVIVDPLSTAAGSPGECIAVFGPHGDKGSCRPMVDAPTSLPWAVFAELVGAPIVAWAGLGREVAVVRVMHEDGSVSVQVPRNGIVVVPIASGETVRAESVTTDGMVVRLET